MRISLAAALLLAGFTAEAKKPKKDRGEATMKVADTVWSAQRASARIRDDRLSITATWSERVENVRRSETVRLVIKGYAGPGEYEANASSSFAKVGVDLDKIKASEGDDKATSKAVTDLLKKSEVILLRGAKVVIMSANAEEVRGTFSQDKRSTGPMITEGQFRALVKKKRSNGRRLNRGKSK